MSTGYEYTVEATFGGYGPVEKTYHLCRRRRWVRNRVVVTDSKQEEEEVNKQLHVFTIVVHEKDKEQMYRYALCTGKKWRGALFTKATFFFSVIEKTFCVKR